MTSPMPPRGNRSASAIPMSTKLRQATERVNFLWISTLYWFTSRRANASFVPGDGASEMVEKAAGVAAPAGRRRRIGRDGLGRRLAGAEAAGRYARSMRSPGRRSVGATSWRADPAAPEHAAELQQGAQVVLGEDRRCRAAAGRLTDCREAATRSIISQVVISRSPRWTVPKLCLKAFWMSRTLIVFSTNSVTWTVAGSAVLYSWARPS